MNGRASESGAAQWKEANQQTSEKGLWVSDLSFLEIDVLKAAVRAHDPTPQFSFVSSLSLFPCHRLLPVLFSPVDLLL